MKKIELLSPAGNMESLKSAVMAGADAIYLGGVMFSARAFANNFTNDELIEAIKYCHLYGVKVYVTCNIIVYEHEVNRFLEYVEFLHKINVDAILIQDLGMLDLVHQMYPNLEIHASTQMHIHNLDGVIMANKLGCKRVVIARETPIEKIEEIINKTNIDIEVFAHGSLCVSYSGQCLFSSLIGNRSGNRGSCVGSCRLPYSIIDQFGNVLNDGDYPLSMKDLNTLENVGRLIDIGVTSLKIEGRMKSPEYVYIVTKLYREAIDSYYKYGKVNINNKLLNELQRIFNRRFTKGYLFHEDYKNIINSDRPNHQGVYIGKVIDYNKNYITIRLVCDVSIGDGLRIVLNKDDYGITLNEFYINNKLVKEAKENDLISVKVNKKIPINSKVLLTKDVSLIKDINSIINSNPRKVLVDVSVIAKIDKPLKMIVNDGINNIEVNGEIVEKSINNSVSKDSIIERVNKVGNTIYKINKLDIIMDNDIFISFKSINVLRRELFNKLNESRLYNTNFIKGNYYREVNNFKNEKLTSVLVSKISSPLNYDIIYSEDITDNAIIKLPRVIDNYKVDNNREYLISELGAFNQVKNIYTDYSFNVVNSYTVALLHSLGAKRVTLSLELSKKQMKNIVDEYKSRYKKNPNLEVIVAGYREVMILKTNLNSIYNNNLIWLKDRFNNRYKIREVNGLSSIYEPFRYTVDDNYYNDGINVLRVNKEVSD